MAPTKDQISQESYDTFIKDAAGWNVDLSSLPSIQARQVKKSKSGDTFIDDRFAPLASDRPHKLRKALTKFANDNHSDREVADVLKQGGVVDGSEGRTGTCIFTISATGEELPVEIEWIDGTWTGTANGKRYHALTRDGVLSLISKDLNNNVRNLTSAELREITILCNTAGEGFYSGVKRYVAKRTGMDEDEVLTDAAIRDSKTSSVYDSGVLHCWLAIRPDFSPGEDFGAFVAQFAMGRHLSVALLDGCRKDYERRSEAMAREALMSTISPDAEQSEEPPTYNQLDALNDDELAAQFRGVRRTQARLVRGGIL